MNGSRVDVNINAATITMMCCSTTPSAVSIFRYRAVVIIDEITARMHLLQMISYTSTTTTSSSLMKINRT